MSYDDETLNYVFDKGRGRCWWCGKKLSWKNYGKPGEKGAWEVYTTVTLFPEEEPIISEILCPRASHVTVANRICDGDRQHFRKEECLKIELPFSAKRYN